MTTPSLTPLETAAMIEEESSSSSSSTSSSMSSPATAGSAINRNGLLRVGKALVLFLFQSNLFILLLSMAIEKRHVVSGRIGMIPRLKALWPFSLRFGWEAGWRREEESKRLNVPLKLVTGGSCLAKVDLPLAVSWMGQRCGEDAWLVSSSKFEVTPRSKWVSLLSVADGVGGWAMYGGDSSKISHGILQSLGKRLGEKAIGVALKKETNFTKMGLPDLIKESFAELVKEGTLQMGSTTLTASLFDPEEGSLEVVNIGDSMLAQFRLGGAKAADSLKLECIFRTPSGTWGFNSPHQIGFGEAGVPLSLDPLEAATHHRLELRAGDILVLGSDGLFDNVWIEEIEAILLTLLKTTIPSDKDSNAEEAWTKMAQERIQSSAKILTWMARVRAEETLWESPFSSEAVKAGKAEASYRGGKVDDVAVIIALVVKDN